MKKNIKPINDKGKRHGYWEWYWTDDTLFYKGYYVNGKVVGYKEFYTIGNKLELSFHV